MLWMAMPIVCGGVAMCSAVTQMLGLGYYRKTLACYDHGVERPIDTNIKQLIQEVLQDTDIKPDRAEELQFFTCFDNSPLHKGAMGTRTGAIIGIPPTFAYKSTNDVDLGSFTVGSNQKKVDPDSPISKELRDSLVLSSRAKRFAIGREINYANTSHLYVDTLVKASCITASYSCLYYMSDLLQIKQRLPRAAKYTVYGLAVSGLYMFYLILSDTYYCWRDEKVDKRTAGISQEYARGGVEFYGKVLQRNRAVRSVMGDFGARFYTPYGNEVATWRNRNVQLTARLELLKQCLKDKEQTRPEEAVAA